MKKIILPLLSVLISTAAMAQTWKWAKEAIAPNQRVSSGVAIATDDAGNSYVTGYFRDTVTIGGVTYGTDINFDDTFLAKYDPNGGIIWIKRIGFNGKDDRPFDLLLDKGNRLYLTGVFNIVNQMGDTLRDQLYVIFDTNGQYINSYTYTSAQYPYYISRLSVDDSGNVYGIGTLRDRDTLLFDTTYLIVPNIYSDFFIAKWDSLGQLKWAKQVGGTKDNYAYGLAVSGSGNIFVTGSFVDTSMFDTTQIISHKAQDVFMAKFNTDGKLAWVRNAGSSLSSNEEAGYDVGIDSLGNCYVTGRFVAWNAYFDTLYISIAAGSATQVFLAKYDTSGKFLWVRYGECSFNASGKAVHIDSKGRVTIAGYFNRGATNWDDSMLLTSPTDSIPLYDAGPGIDNAEIFVAQYDYNGGLLMAKAAGGKGDDYLMDVDLDGSGNIYGTGEYTYDIRLGSISLATTSFRPTFFIAKLGDMVTSAKPVNSSSNKFFVFPNPASDNIKITGNGFIAKKIAIIDISGKTVQEIITDSDKIDVSNFLPGVYFIRVITDQDTVTYKFIKN